MDDSHPWLAAVVECSDDAIITKTLQGVITSWNPAAERLVGYSASEAVGRPVAMLVPAGRAEEEPRILARIANGERVDHFETERIRKDGSVVAVSVTISPVRDRQGRIVGASKIARDISERRKVDARVQTQLARLFTLDQITRAIGERQDLREIFQVALRAVEERLPVDFACMCSVDESCRQLVITELGGRGSRIGRDLALSEGCFLPLDESTWRRWTDGSLTYLDDLHGMNATLARRLARGGLESMVLAPLKADGKVESLMVCARRFPDSFSSTDCEFLLQLATHVALAARHAGLLASLQKAYDELRAGQEAAARQQRLHALGQMASGVAHDIGNLVLPATFFARELMDREKAISPEGSKTLSLIKGCLDDVSAIVERLRDFYRARETSVVSEAVDLKIVVDQVVALTRPRCAERSVLGAPSDVRATIDDGVPAIAGSESEIREALVNLVLNALDAMPLGGTVRLRLRNVEQQAGDDRPPAVEVCVQDDGIGMDDETRRRCVEPFFTTKGDTGTGMGLAMVYGAVQRHGADMVIDSAPDKGTTITIRFPNGRSPSPLPRRPSAIETAPQRARRRLHVLLVDDDPLVLETLQNMLLGTGHEIATAGGGQAGIEAFRDALQGGAGYDVVVTDLGMPAVDGLAVAKSIKRLSPATPIVLLTGWGEGIQRNADSGSQIAAVLGKPPGRSELADVLARVVQASSLAP